ncbi:thiamine-monophosphate kinase [Gracilibacillus boraciitolerans JCM 21714]|uniref:Thiamine-monophosphate kinase n=2 Tax=Gracilibacillus boraciitolerans TaxID=307521 RepID=W4VQ22_9BACI|nr:thiamine-monophosphate kinase [Gracilibacillus boraciitolerans JCM 21714]
MVEDIHFSTMTTEPFHIGYRALAANISDIAAMGGKPTSYLVSIVIPKKWSAKSLHQIYDGMKQLAKDYRMDLIGGDTVSGKQLTLSITVIGTVNADKVRYRNSAREDDIIFVTGTLGDAACGLHLLLNKDQMYSDKYQYFLNRHQLPPQPRIDFINTCTAIDRITLNDVSDGIANELNEIADASHKKLVIDFDTIPVHTLLADFTKEQQTAWKLSGGEDFELVGTVSVDNWIQLKEAALKTNTPITAIGKVKNDAKNNGSVWLNHNNQLKKLDKSGYTHLRR